MMLRLISHSRYSILDPNEIFETTDAPNCPRAHFQVKRSKHNSVWWHTTVHVHACVQRQFKTIKTKVSIANALATLTSSLLTTTCLRWQVIRHKVESWVDQRMFKLEIRKNFLMERVVKHWNRISREAQEVCGVFILGDIRETCEHGTKEHGLVVGLGRSRRC